MSATRPSWQTDQCPDWCVSEHREDDLPDDRIHDSAGSYFTAVLLDPDAATPERETAMYVALFRNVNSLEDWIHIGAPDETPPAGVTLSAESARRLATSLREKVAASLA